jgi:uncharacterized protein with von Willebrand factor type A (vWA) domain
MFLPFLDHLRREGVPVSLREFLTFLEALAEGLGRFDVDDFYHLARAAMVKDERHLDRFDRAFAAAFRGLEQITDQQVLEALDLPEEWLRKLAERHLSPEDMAAVQALGGFDKLMETLRKRLAEQKGRHQGGNKWIGTAGTSPFGAYGYNPEGVRIGQDESRHRRAVKVWDKREFRNLDDRVEIGTRNIKVALRAAAAGRATARPKSWTWTAPSAPPPNTAGWMCRPGPSGATRSRCCCSWIWAAAWTRTSR